MTNREKIDLLETYDDIAILEDEHFVILKNLSFDDDVTIKSMVAPLLVDFPNSDAKDVLIRLAKDDDSLVRTEAYDSLSVFPFPDVQVFLQGAMTREKNSLARSYAILSWTDVSLSMGYTVAGAPYIRGLRRKEKSDNCLLSYSYALYRFGDKEELDILLSFLQNSNYQIRCATLALLEDIIDESNIKCIENHINILLASENSVAVIETAKKFLSEH